MNLLNEKIIVLTHNPKGDWGDVRPIIEQEKGYKNWNKSINVEIGQFVLIYISKTAFRIEYLMRVVKINDTSIDLELVEKFDENIAKSLSYDNLLKHGLKPATVNYILNNNIELYKYVLSVLKEENMSKNINSNQPLNQILFGPPGTGKTFNTINKAIEIIENRFLSSEELKPENRKALKDKFEEYKKAGQIEFVTFHQSYGYEEFVEGIKAIPVGKEGNEDGNEMIYAISDGIFKKLSKKSLEEFLITNTSSNINKKRFILNAKSLNIQAELIQDDENNFRVIKGSKMRKGYASSFEQYNYFKLRKEVEKNAKLKEESEFFIFEEDYLFQSLSAASSVILGRMSNGTIDWKETFENLNIEKVEDISEIKNHILIIDEINRGNISKIFGELITLIEPSKRIGADEEIKVKLPYSNDDFGVPQNLYIFGTMNTADRSIALMDTALRRRFEFIEMLPKAELLDFEVDGINIKLMLEKINQRVEYLYDRDHTIGHAYFIGLKEKATLKELENIFKNKIIPLLQEYFYDDWEKILMVLGKGFIEKKVISNDIFDYKVDDYLEQEKYVYKIKDKFDFSSFK